MAFSFGASGASAAPATGGFSFGGASAAPASTGFSFGGSTPAATSAAPASTGGFSFGGSSGSSTTTTAAPASTGFSFGGNSTPAAAPAAASSTGFSFGGSSTPAAAPASTGFSFGGASATPAPASTGFSFGGSNTTPAPASTGFSFGGASSTPAAAPASTGFNFGSTAAAPSTSSFSFGSAPAATPSLGFGAAPGNTKAISLDTRFEDLPADVQKQLIEFGTFVKEQSREEASIRAVSSAKLTQLKESTTHLEQAALVLQNIHARQAKNIGALKTDVKDLVVQAESADQTHLHMTSETGIQRHEPMPSPYYWSLVQHFESRLATLKGQMTDVHSQLQGAKHDDVSMDADEASTVHMTPRVLQETLQSQNEAFMRAAARVADVHERADTLRDQYLSRQQAAPHGFGLVRNPFEAADRVQAEEERRIVDRIRLSAAQSTLPASSSTAVATTAAAPTATAASTLFSFGAATTPAPAAAPATGGFSFGAAAATPAAPSAFGTSSFGAAATGAVPSLTKSVSFSGLGTPQVTPDAGAFGANKSARRPKTKKR
ncbi:hypothetical protein SDRG_03345 [Saprolegnia diclina VS20]|uniref:Nucleoporin p58/p45 n=1 Tax=Saprolegnia diclina (strain VS20) TaxID=1156394 RepID=T0S2F3_SAPDV|nr:hypothetical protein SDRG_03345 [Saprolegnia diclina VS20]EQC39138.1 hypothetical protein SDRG_03345 [Saprolegnia diclina VS20]|eukprot:XP_008607199.1 hypothetical protein SDRG_03345 [Saprolegnia diclina VS20]